MLSSRNDKEQPMDTVKILEVKQSIFASNDEQAEALRKDCLLYTSRCV